jgi:hypothetical protein
MKFLQELKPKSFTDWAILATAFVWFIHGLIESLT